MMMNKFTGYTSIYMNSVDKELLESAKKGDMDSFVTLFEPLRGLVHAVAYRMVGANDADDVTMETFLRAWKALPGFRGGSSLRTWICRIARNCCIDLTRKKKHVGELAGPEDVTEGWNRLPDENAVDPASRLLKEEDAERVRRALDQLSPEHRQTVLLRFADELSYLEICAATGASLGTVMSRLYYAKRKLHNLFIESDGKND